MDWTGLAPICLGGTSLTSLQEGCVLLQITEGVGGGMVGSSGPEG